MVFFAVFFSSALATATEPAEVMTCEAQASRPAQVREMTREIVRTSRAVGMGLWSCHERDVNAFVFVQETSVCVQRGSTICLNADGSVTVSAALDICTPGKEEALRSLLQTLEACGDAGYHREGGRP